MESRASVPNPQAWNKSTQLGAGEGFDEQDQAEPPNGGAKWLVDSRPCPIAPCLKMRGHATGQHTEPARTTDPPFCCSLPSAVLHSIRREWNGIADEDVSCHLWRGGIVGDDEDTARTLRRRRSPIAVDMHEDFDSLTAEPSSLKDYTWPADEYLLPGMTFRLTGGGTSNTMSRAPVITFTLDAKSKKEA